MLKVAVRLGNSSVFACLLVNLLLQWCHPPWLHAWSHWDSTYCNRSRLQALSRLINSANCLMLTLDTQTDANIAFCSASRQILCVSGDKTWFIEPHIRCCANMLLHHLPSLANLFVLVRGFVLKMACVESAMRSGPRIARLEGDMGRIQLAWPQWRAKRWRAWLLDVMQSAVEIVHHSLLGLLKHLDVQSGHLSAWDCMKRCMLTIAASTSLGPVFLWSQGSRQRRNGRCKGAQTSSLRNKR